MKHTAFFVLVILILVPYSLIFAQLPSPQMAAPVPRLVKFSGSLMDVAGKPLTGIAGVTFTLYKNQQGGSPLWLETQNVMPDAAGLYTVLLGSTKADGLPVDLFSSGDARWLGVQVQGQPEQPRVLIVAVPYALKAGDAETVGGLRPSAFVLAAPSNVVGNGSTINGGYDNRDSATLPNIGGSGTTNYVPLWTSNTNLGNSILYQTGGKVGVNITTPATTFDVNGTADIRGAFSLPATGKATQTQGYNSYSQNFTASSYDSTNKAAVPQGFRWQAEPVGNNTPNASASLNLLFGSGSSQPHETGLYIGSNGQINFASGQKFLGAGTVTSVGSGAGLKGGPITQSGTLSLDTGYTDARYAQLNASNTFAASQTIGGSLNVRGAFKQNVITAQGDPELNPIGVTGTGATGVVGNGYNGVSGYGDTIGVAGYANEGYGVYAQAGYGPIPGTAGIYAVGPPAGHSIDGAGVWGVVTDTANSTAGVFQHMGGGKVLSGRTGANLGTEVFSVGGNGMVTGKAFVSAINTVPFSPTPTFDASLGNVQKIVLTGNVNSSTLTNAVPGQVITFLICDDSVGGEYLVFPPGFRGLQITGGLAANHCQTAMFLIDTDGATGFYLGGFANQ